MNLTVTQLREQYDRSTVNWDWIRDAEDLLSVPPFLLYALGSRETNLKNVVGDGGHGWGIWQRDNRSFTIPADYLTTVLRQANDAGALLMSHFGYFRSAYPDSPAWSCSVAAYNAGRTGVKRRLDIGATPDSATTGGDYSADVIQRWQYMVRWGWGDI